MNTPTGLAGEPRNHAAEGELFTPQMNRSTPAGRIAATSRAGPHDLGASCSLCEQLSARGLPGDAEARGHHPSTFAASAACTAANAGFGRSCSSSSVAAPIPACVSEIHERPSVKPQNVSDAHSTVAAAAHDLRVDARLRLAASPALGGSWQPDVGLGDRDVQAERGEALHVRDEVGRQPLEVGVRLKADAVDRHPLAP